jgi:hypothetical protein
MIEAQLIKPVPESAGLPPTGNPSTQFEYRDASGALLGVVCRYDKEGGKDIVPYTFWGDQDGGSGWQKKIWPEPRPLYGLDRLSNQANEPVIVCEGEKAADAAQKLFSHLPCITTSGGCNAAHKTDLTPLANKDVVIWPDADEAGKKYADALVELLRPIVSSVKVLPVSEDKPKGWDAADALEEGWDQERAKAYLANAASAAKKTLLKSLTLESFLSLKIPPREIIVDPIIPKQGLVMLYAPRGIGKTYVALSIAVAVAKGAATLGGRWKATKPSRVLYIDGEMTAVDMQKRLKDLSGNSLNEMPSQDYFKLITPDMQEVGMPDLCSEEGRDAIEQHTNGVDLIILDNLSALARKGKENEAESWMPIQELLLSWRRRGISVLIVHHAGKGGLQRGTSKREDLLDTVIALKNPNDHDQQKGASFEVHYEKARGFYGEKAKPFEATSILKDGAFEWAVKDLEDSLSEKVFALHADGYKQREIAEELGCSAAKVNRLLKKKK